ncbi:MAG TPA: 2-phospho-L-lactate guanylyltransferase [Tepidiformaceae bacterium]|nr:2-phospho-L-lactate guanylyltransferase [Tepidiformaceae bacterium]
MIPANDLDRAKGRLASLLSPGERRMLFLATLQTVVGACAEAGLPAVVLTRDRRIIEALPEGVRVIEEDDSVSGLNGQLERAVRLLAADDIVILHADLPFATAAALRAFVDAGSAGPAVTLVRSRDGGTNAMRLTPPGAFALAYGRDSFAAHREAARAAGASVEIVEIPELALDIDTVDDLFAVMETPGGTTTGIGALLQSFALRERLAVDE